MAVRPVFEQSKKKLQSTRGRLPPTIARTITVRQVHALGTSSAVWTTGSTQPRRGIPVSNPKRRPLHWWSAALKSWILSASILMGAHGPRPTSERRVPCRPRLYGSLNDHPPPTMPSTGDSPLTSGHGRTRQAIPPRRRDTRSPADWTASCCRRRRPHCANTREPSPGPRPLEPTYHTYRRAPGSCYCSGKGPLLRGRGGTMGSCAVGLVADWLGRCHGSGCTFHASRRGQIKSRAAALNEISAYG